MPGLSNYWCYADGRCQNVKSEVFLEEHKGVYRTYDDKIDLSPVSTEEIITYYKHIMQMLQRMKAHETETVTYRPYPMKLHAIVDEDGTEVMILNRFMLDAARNEGIPKNYKIVKY